MQRMMNLNSSSTQTISQMKSQQALGNALGNKVADSLSNMNSPVLQFTNLQLPASSQLIEMAARLSPHTLASTMAAMAAVNSNPSQQQQQQCAVSSDVADVLHRLSAASALFQHLQQSSVITDYSQQQLTTASNQQPHTTNGQVTFRSSISHDPSIHAATSACSSPIELPGGGGGGDSSVGSVFRKSGSSLPNYDLAMDLKIDSKASAIVQPSVVPAPSTLVSGGGGTGTAGIKQSKSNSNSCLSSSKSSKDGGGSGASRPHRQNFTPLQNKILTEWYHEHKEKPYPSTEETNMLTKKADLSYPQVKKWFANKRARTSMCIKKPARSNNSTGDLLSANHPDNSYQLSIKMDGSIKSEAISDDECSQSSNSMLGNDHQEDEQCKLLMNSDATSHVSTIFPAFNESACSPDDPGSNEDVISSHISNTAKAF